MCLYRRAPGERFESLRRFHESPGSATGTVDIVHGSGPLRRLLAGLMGLPRPGRAVPVTLSVEAYGKGEVWTRHFGATPLVTRQWVEECLLMEAAGPYRFAFRMGIEAIGITFVLVRCWLLGVPLPRPLAPTGEASTKGDEDGWRLWVRIGAPAVGMLVEYGGRMDMG